MILKIITKGQGVRFIECDSIAVNEVQLPAGDNEMEAQCRMGENQEVVYFSDGYLMENGKTIEHLFIAPKHGVTTEG